MAGMLRRRRFAVALVCVAALVGSACSSEDSTTTAPEGSGDATTTTAAASAPLKILAANDDGISHPGLDLMVRTLAALDNVEVTVIAPATNQSGTSDRTTPGGASYGPATTASGVEATAVEGFPADSVRVALDELGLTPDLVVSGINDAQNVGPFAGLSGTVGVARTAVREGIPAIAVSAGTTYVEEQFAVGAALVVAWIEDNREALVERTLPPEVISFNIPACDPADMGEVVEVPLATEFPEGTNVFESDCDPSGPTPANDVLAIVAGFPTRTVVPEDIESVVPGS
jgi:5'-nucleotidase